MKLSSLLGGLALLGLAGFVMAQDAPASKPAAMEEKKEEAKP